tara:strand:+ start:235 stop:339 length:105 start_codon:yes stop_codon:yes gene_type:complete
VPVEASVKYLASSFGCFGKEDEGFVSVVEKTFGV